eukprot:11213108-Alexandrium_andersonii.AAC.1
MGFTAVASEAPLAPCSCTPSFPEAMLARVHFVEQREREVISGPNQGIRRADPSDRDRRCGKMPPTGRTGRAPQPRGL